MIILTVQIPQHEQVDILVSKNQALQILYLKHHVYKLSQVRNLIKSTKIKHPYHTVLIHTL